MSTPSIRRVSHLAILCAPNAQQLIDEYAAECSNRLIGPIAQQPEIYAQLEASGIIAFLGVYEADDELIGFGSFVTAVLPHNGRKIASSESIFVTRDHRSIGTARGLMNALEDLATESGCVAFFYMAPDESQFAKLLAASHSYTRTNVVYCRSLA